MLLVGERNALFTHLEFPSATVFSLYIYFPEIGPYFSAVDDVYIYMYVYRPHREADSCLVSKTTRSRPREDDTELTPVSL